MVYKPGVKKYGVLNLKRRVKLTLWDENARRRERGRENERERERKRERERGSERERGRERGGTRVMG